MTRSLFLSKTQKFDQSCYWNEEKKEPVCFSGKFNAASIQVSPGENTSFTIRPQFPGSQNHVSLQFQNCVKTFLGHTVPFHEKIGQRKVLFECWLPYLLWHWLREIVVMGLPSKKWQTACFFLKNKKLNQSCLQWKEKWTSGFFWQDEVAYFQLPKVKNTGFSIRAQFPGLQKHDSWTYCTIPWEKMSGESVLWTNWLTNACSEWNSFISRGLTVIYKA